MWHYSRPTLRAADAAGAAWELVISMGAVACRQPHRSIQPPAAPLTLVVGPLIMAASVVTSQKALLDIVQIQI